MKKYLIMLLLPLFAATLSGCDDRDDMIDVKLIEGQWQVVSQDSPERDCIYSFTTPENTWSWGLLTTYYFSISDTPVHDKVYDWHVSDPANDETVYLDITLKGELDSDDPWEYSDRFVIEKLTASEMVLRKHEVGDTKTRLTFARRNDLQLP